MNAAYIEAAMRKAKYTVLEDASFYGVIPGFQGVWASSDNLHACSEELRSVLEGWILHGARLSHRLPALVTPSNDGDEWERL